VKLGFEHDATGDQQEDREDGAGNVAPMSGQLATPGWAGERARNQKIAIVLRDSLGASRGVLA
jgi:hypothetical protein